MSNVLSLLGRRATIIGQSKKDNPYTFYDWIQRDDTDNTCYIAVGLDPDMSTDWEFKGSFARTADYASNWTPLWIFTRTIKEGYLCNYSLSRKAPDNSGNLAFNYNGRANTSSYAGSPTTKATKGVWHTFELGPTEGEDYGGTLTLDGTETVNYTPGSRPNAGSSDLKLLAGFPCRLGRFKAYEVGVLVADLVPAVRNSDNVVGFYDIVRETFYPPTGEATFTAGNGLEDFNT